jgi:hypothetical protein
MELVCDLGELRREQFELTVNTAFTGFIDNETTTAVQQLLAKYSVDEES